MLLRSILVFSLIGFANGATAASLTAHSVWKNDKGSVLTVKTVKGDTFTGLYLNKASGFECTGKPRYDVSGHVNGDTVSFVVTWKNAAHDCHTVTVWNGTISGNTLTTKWDLAYVDTHWKLQMLSGADTFTKK